MFIIEWGFISGVMFGFEWMEEHGLVIIDLGIVRLLIYKGEKEE
jgi:hypothetical protein